MSFASASVDSSYRASSEVSIVSWITYKFCLAFLSCSMKVCFMLIFLKERKDAASAKRVAFLLQQCKLLRACSTMLVFLVLCSVSVLQWKALGGEKRVQQQAAIPAVLGASPFA